MQTLAARANGTLLAKKAEIDLLLRLAGTSQISDAIKKAGCREQGETLLIVAGSDKSVRRLLAMRKIGGRRLRSAVLDDKDKMRIEKAAVLGALRT
jgi:tRNA threonylcarbamoyladenosine modification (KEOPS) complex Cgi121 subunit